MLDVVNVEDIVKNPFITIRSEFSGENIENAVHEIYQVLLPFEGSFDIDLQ